MDLGAYAQISNLEQILKDNNINIPRLRGLRLMKDEDLITPEDFAAEYKEADFWAINEAVRGDWFWNSYWHTQSRETDRQLEYYVDFARREDGSFDHFEPLKLHWERLHGDKRKLVKYKIKKKKARIKKQWEMWNKYCGQENILYIHARLGAGNWDGYNCDEIIKKQPWYIEHCEDQFDSTYVDIYAKIGDN